jgi:hypothetical protein
MKLLTITAALLVACGLSASAAHADEQDFGGLDTRVAWKTAVGLATFELRCPATVLPSYAKEIANELLDRRGRGTVFTEAIEDHLHGRIRHEPGPLSGMGGRHCRRTSPP